MRVSIIEKSCGCFFFLVKDIVSRWCFEIDFIILMEMIDFEVVEVFVIVVLKFI